MHINGLFGKQVRKYRRALIYDDEVATGSSVVELCKVLVRQGIEEIVTICTHELFSSNTFERLAAIPQIVELVTTDTVPPPPPEKRPANLTVMRVAPSTLWLSMTMSYMARKPDADWVMSS